MIGDTAASQPLEAARTSFWLDAIGWTGLTLIVGGGLARAAARIAEDFGDPVAATLAEWPVLAGSTLGCVAVLAAVEALGHRSTSSLAPRKAAHVCGCLMMFAGGWYFHSHWPVLAFAILATLFLGGGPLLGLMQPLRSRGRHGYGDLVFPAGLYFAFVLAHDSPAAYQAAVLCLGVSDVAAAAIGTRYGRPDWWVAGNWRSLVGSTTFMVSALLIVSGCLLLNGYPPGLPVLVTGLLVAAAVTVVEALSPLGLDNVTIPIAAVFAMEAVRYVV